MTTRPIDAMLPALTFEARRAEVNRVHRGGKNSHGESFAARMGDPIRLMTGANGDKSPRSTTIGSDRGAVKLAQSINALAVEGNVIRPSANAPILTAKELVKVTGKLSTYHDDRVMGPVPRNSHYEVNACANLPRTTYKVDLPASIAVPATWPIFYGHRADTADILPNAIRAAALIDGMRIVSWPQFTDSLLIEATRVYAARVARAARAADRKAKREETAKTARAAAKTARALAKASGAPAPRPVHPPVILRGAIRRAHPPS